MVKFYKFLLSFHFSNLLLFARWKFCYAGNINSTPEEVGHVHMHITQERIGYDTKVNIAYAYIFHCLCLVW